MKYGFRNFSSLVDGCKKKKKTPHSLETAGVGYRPIAINILGYKI